MKATRWACLGLATVVMGCTAGNEESTSGESSTEQLTEGLTIFEQSPDWGMNAAFKQDGRVVYLQTRVGEAKIEMYRNAFPDEPENEMDARVLDEQGRTIYIQQGGDLLVEPTWRDDLVNTLIAPMPDVAEQDTNHGLIVDAAKAFEAMPAASLPHHDLVTVFNARQMFDRETRADLHAEGEVPYSAGAYDCLDSPSGPKWEIHIHVEGMWYTVGLGEHTATLARVNGVHINSCNHGKCAASMPHRCSEGTQASNIESNYKDKYHETSTSTGSVNGNCKTSYNALSTWNHNCHDDTVRSLRAFHLGPQDGPYDGMCNNWNTHTLGPNCGHNDGW